jgi:phosphoglycerate dehydrogenase-like enzyme
MISAERIEMLNQDAVVVNVARGQVIDEQAMIVALQSGRLGGAVLDVFEKEPLPESSPLWSLPNVVISPHSSGFRSSHWDDVVQLFVENVRRFREDQELVNRVDPFAGY